MRIEEKQIVGPWMMIRRLGKGGNGEVWFARREGNISAAVKVLFATSHTSRSRFRSEIAVQRQLTGRPGILPVIDALVPDNDEDIAWLATPQAQKLTDVLAEASLEGIVSAMASIAETLASLADEGISHRDIKPDNLLFLDGNPVLADFGLADYPLKEAITAAGKKLGPMYYIAPEMFTHPEAADGRHADVYSLIKVLWVLATGQNFPPQGEIRIDVPSLLLSTYVNHPRAYILDRLIERATRTEPDARPRMHDVAAELRAWLTPLKETMDHDDLSDIAARIGAVVEPYHRAEQTAQQLVEQADNVLEHLRDQLAPLVATITDATHTDGELGSSLMILEFFGEPLRIGGSGPIWRNGLCLQAISPGIEQVILTCGIGGSLSDTGELFLNAGYQVHYGVAGVGMVARGDCPAFRQAHSGRAPIGSAQQENLVADMVAFLWKTAWPALNHYALTLERIKETRR